ncbi:MAG: UbiD family decarboxylase, partial [Thermodesulfobacteriota bacterium]
MTYSDLRGFIDRLDKEGLVKRVTTEVSTDLEIAAITERLVQSGGPAVIFENVKGHDMPVVTNLYGTRARCAMGLGVAEDEFSEIGELIAFLQRPKPPEGMWDAVKSIPFYGKMLTLGPKTVRSGACQEVVKIGADADLSKLPIIQCWPGDVAPLVTWPLVVTRSPDGTSGNVGVYRMQYLDEHRLIMRWLPHRGGARHLRQWAEHGNEPMPVAVAIGCEPATTLAAVTPVPDDVDEFLFAGILRKKAIELVECKTIPLKVPATAEIVLEGEIRQGGAETEM